MIVRILDSDGERLELQISDADWPEQLEQLECVLEQNPEWFGEAWRPDSRVRPPGALRTLPEILEVDQAVELLRLLNALEMLGLDAEPAAPGAASDCDLDALEGLDRARF